MAKTLLAIGAHYDDCVFGIPGILLQAVRKHYHVVVLSVIGDYTNWPPVQGREKEFTQGVVDIGKEYGAEMRYLKYASHRYDVNLETKRAVSEVVAQVQPEVAFMMWPHDRHHDHEVAAVLGKIALQHGNRVLEKSSLQGRRGQSTPSTTDQRHTIGFEPNTFVDVTAEWPTAMEWLGRFMALVGNRPYDRNKPDSGVRSKEVLAAYRGQACGVRWAEAVWSMTPQVREVL